MKITIPVCEPFLDGNELKYVTDAVSTGWISSSGSYVKAFEEQFAAYCGARYATSVCNGTVALHLALVALGVGKGDEVIIPDFTMMSCALAVCYTGAMPVFVDADPATWNMDAAKIEAKITAKTKVIMPVHIFGNPCPMDAIRAIAKQHKLAVLEDGAEAIGSAYHGTRVGALADIAAFSFFANKNLTTGEGGMVVTDDKALYDQCRYYKNVCFPLDGPREYVHDHLGFNYRLSNLHAAVGLAQVEKADQYVGCRVRNGELYRALLGDVAGIRFQADEPDCVNAYWMNGILVDPAVYGRTKAQLMAHLADKGIETRLFFTGMHRQKSLQAFGCDVNGQYPVTDNLTANGFYLPSGSNLSVDQIGFICENIRGFGI